MRLFVSRGCLPDGKPPPTESVACIRLIAEDVVDAGSVPAPQPANTTKENTMHTAAIVLDIQVPCLSTPGGARK